MSEIMPSQCKKVEKPLLVSDEESPPSALEEDDMSRWETARNSPCARAFTGSLEL